MLLVAQNEARLEALHVDESTKLLVQFISSMSA